MNLGNDEFLYKNDGNCYCEYYGNKFNSDNLKIVSYDDGDDFIDTRVSGICEQCGKESSTWI